jgi:hypothetical protein
VQITLDRYGTCTRTRSGRPLVGSRRSSRRPLHPAAIRQNSRNARNQDQYRGGWKGCRNVQSPDEAPPAAVRAEEPTRELARDHVAHCVSPHPANSSSRGTSDRVTQCSSRIVPERPPWVRKARDHNSIRCDRARPRTRSPAASAVPQLPPRYQKPPQLAAPSDWAMHTYVDFRETAGPQ